MNAAYAIYVFVCCCQTALFILNIALGKHVTCQMLLGTPYNNAPAILQLYNETVVVETNSSSGSIVAVVFTTHIVNLDKSTALCCSMACIIGLLYILVVRANDDYPYA